MRPGVKPFYNLTETGLFAGGVAAETIRGWIWEDRIKVRDGILKKDSKDIRFPNAKPRGLVPLKDILRYTELTPELLAMVEFPETDTEAGAA